MEHQLDVVTFTTERGERFKGTCSCGWQSDQDYDTHWAAQEVGERHREASA
jgi:hypothetical protein